MKHFFAQRLSSVILPNDFCSNDRTPYRLHISCRTSTAGVGLSNRCPVASVSRLHSRTFRSQRLSILRAIWPAYCLCIAYIFVQNYSVSEDYEPVCFASEGMGIRDCCFIHHYKPYRWQSQINPNWITNNVKRWYIIASIIWGKQIQNKTNFQ